MGIQERREREREARRSAVLDATRTLVRERGFNGTTTKLIAKECELSEATVFWYFQSKDEIFVSLLFEASDFMAHGIEKIEAKGLDARDTLRALWNFFSEVRSEHPEYFHVFSYVAHPQSTASVAEEVKTKIAQRTGDNFRRLSDLFAGRIGTGQSRILVDLLWSSFFGLMVLRESRENLGAKAHPTSDELQSALEALLDGMITEP